MLPSRIECATQNNVTKRKCKSKRERNEQKSAYYSLSNRIMNRISENSKLRKKAKNKLHVRALYSTKLQSYWLRFSLLQTNSVAFGREGRSSAELQRCGWPQNPLGARSGASRRLMNCHKLTVSGPQSVINNVGICKYAVYAP